MSSMSTSKEYLARINTLMSNTDTKTNAIKTEFENSTFDFSTVSSKGFTKSNVISDLANSNNKFAVKEISTGPVADPVDLRTNPSNDEIKIIPNIPLNGKDGVLYANPVSPSNICSFNPLTTIVSDGSDTIRRWTSRTIFKFLEEYYGYDRCMFRIPIESLANGGIINGENDAQPHNTTLAAYPYPEEIIMISAGNPKKFIHFINIQYSDNHCGKYNGRSYNFMITHDRIRYGELNPKNNTEFDKYTSIYVNDINTELAFFDMGYIYIPMPDSLYGEELLNSLWECRVIWRKDAPNKTINAEVSIEATNNSSSIAWKNTKISDTSRYWDSVCYGNGKFVAVAQNTNVFAYSTDGITWTEGTISNTKRYWYSVCYGNDKFVAVSTNGSKVFAYSNDGITWTEGSLSFYTITITYVKDRFIVCGNPSNTLAYSTDGITWTEGNISSTSRYWRSVCYGNGKFVAVADRSNIFAYSTDGITWTEGNISSTSRYWRSVCYGNGKFVAVSYSNSKIFAYSTDGVTWTETSVSSASWSSVCYGNDKFVAMTTTNIFAYSTDGITWTKGTISSSSTISGSDIIYGGDKFITVGSGTYASYYDGDFILYTSYNDIEKINDRITIINSTNENIANKRNYISSISNTISSIKKSSYNDFILDINGNILMSPDFKNEYSLKKSIEHSWLPTGTPNKFYKISDDRYVGFYYYNPSNRGSFLDIDIDNHSTNLYWALFTNTLNTVKTAVTSEEVTVYPCRYSSSIFTNKGNVLNVYKLNKTKNELIFIVITTQGVYKFNFILENDDLSATFEEIKTYSPSIIKSERVAKYKYFIFTNDKKMYILDVNTKESTEFTGISAVNGFFIGRIALVGINSSNGLLSESYSDDNISFVINSNTQTINPSSVGKQIGRYMIVKDSNSKNRICKLVETYSLS